MFISSDIYKKYQSGSSIELLLDITPDIGFIIAIPINIDI